MPRAARQTAPVADALARLHGADRREVGDERHRRPQAVVGGVAPVRRAAVEGDAAADHVEGRRRVAQQRGRVGGVERGAGKARPQVGRGGAEAHELLGHEGRVLAVGLVGGREVGHEADDIDVRRRRGVGERPDVLRPRAEAPHAGVELEVHARAPAVRGEGRRDPLDRVGRPGRDLRVGRRPRPPTPRPPAAPSRGPARRCRPRADRAPRPRRPRPGTWRRPRAAARATGAAPWP